MELPVPMDRKKTLQTEWGAWKEEGLVILAESWMFAFMLNQMPKEYIIQKSQVVGLFSWRREEDVAAGLIPDEIRFCYNKSNG